MKKLLKLLVAVIALVIVVGAGLALYVSTMDTDKYRPQLVDLISKKTGRTVKLNGPIEFSLGFGGLHVSVQDASLANPAWASRPVMAAMGKFELGIGLLPLLSERVFVKELSIENADILLETNAAGQRNWDFGGAVEAAPAPIEAPSAKAGSSSAVGLSVENLTIVNSQIALRSAEGKVNSYNIASLELEMRGTGAELKLRGDMNGEVITADIKTSLTDLLGKEPFSFDADATYNLIHVAAQGKADPSGGRADIQAYEVTSGNSKITGDLTAMWGGARPALRGTLNSDYLNLADFKSGSITASGDSRDVSSQPQDSSGPKRMFSDAPLPLNALKGADAELAVAVGEFPVGQDALRQISAKLVLSGGELILAPAKASLGAAPVDFQVKLNATQQPAHASLGVVANGVDLGDLQKISNMTPFMSGKASANIQLAGEGNSAHEIASSLGGVIFVTAEKGKILTGAAAGISSTLAAVFSGQGGGDDALNCLAARFIAKNGQLTDNGILIDSSASTVQGNGLVNLGSETINMTLHARTKLVDVGGLVPALQVSGSLSGPRYSVDTAGLVKNVMGSLLNGTVNMGTSSVPVVQAAPKDQNACVYTLAHPKTAASTDVLPADPVSKISQKIQNFGNSVFKGFMGQ